MIMEDLPPALGGKMSREILAREDAMDRRICTACGQVKPLSDFVKDRLKPLGVGSRCRECDNARSREYYARAGAAKRERDASRRAAAVAAYGGKCVDCGTTERLEFDHPNRDGAEHRRAENPKALARRIATAGVIPDRNLELRCAPCHRKVDAKRRVKAMRLRLITTGSKRCPRCVETKPASAFYADKSKSTGLQSACKECSSAIRARRRGAAAMGAAGALADV
jgi:hypothetical protein